MLPNHIGTSMRRIKTSPTRREALGHPDFVMTLAATESRERRRCGARWPASSFEIPAANAGCTGRTARSAGPLIQPKET